MKRRSHGVATCLFLLVVGGAPVRASGQVDVCESEEARAAFEQGLLAASERRLADARSAYTSSLEVCRRVPTAFNLAVVHRQLGSPSEAMALAIQLHEGEFGALDPEQSRVVTTLIRELNSEMGILRLEMSGAPAATVWIDGVPGQQIEESTSVELRLSRGTHRVRVSTADGREREETVEISRPRQRVQLELPLVPARGRIVVTAEDPDAPLEIVGVATGRGRLVRQVLPDLYRVRLRDGGDEEDVRVLRGQTHRVQLSSASIWESPWLWLAVAIVVGGTTALAIVLNPPEAELIEDPVWGRVEL